MPESPAKSPSNLAARLRNVNKSFGDGGSRLQVLKSIDLDVKCGDITMLVGPSGCGKTTLLSIIAGTLAVDPGSGEVNVFGQDLLKMSSRQTTKFRSMSIGFIFQSFNLIPTLTCTENVSVPLLIQGKSTRQAEKRAREVLEQVGLGDRVNHRPTQLSGGQQQRVAIARALITRPALLLADEPTGNLDSRSSIEILALFEQLNAQGITVVLVTHEPDIAEHARRVLTVRDGLLDSDTAGSRWQAPGPAINAAPRAARPRRSIARRPPFRSTGRTL